MLNKINKINKIAEYFPAVSLFMGANIRAKLKDFFVNFKPVSNCCETTAQFKKVLHFTLNIISFHFIEKYTKIKNYGIKVLFFLH